MKSGMVSVWVWCKVLTLHQFWAKCPLCFHPQRRSFQTKNYDKQVLLYLWADLHYAWDNNFPQDLNMKETASRDNEKSCMMQWHSGVYVYFTPSWAQFDPSPGMLIRSPAHPKLFNDSFSSARSSEILFHTDCILPANPGCIPRLCLISILRWKLGAVHFPVYLPFLSRLFSFPHSTWESICVDSWKGCTGWLDIWCGCSKPGFE